MTERKTTSSLHPPEDIESPAFRRVKGRKIDPYLEDIENEAAGAAEAVSRLIALKKKAEHSIAIKAGKGVDPRIMMHIINHLFTAHAAVKNGEPSWIIADPADAIVHIANAIMSSEKVNEELDITDPLTKWINTFTSIGVIVLESLYHLETELLKQEQQTGDDKPGKETNEDGTNTDN